MENGENNNTALQVLDNSSNVDTYGIDVDDGVLGLVPYGFHTDSDNSVDFIEKNILPRIMKMKSRKKIYFIAMVASTKIEM